MISETASTPPAQTTHARIIRIVSSILEIEPTSVLGTQRLREDLGLDSLGSLELLSTIGEELHIDLDMEDAMQIVTVDDACAFVEQNLDKECAHVRRSTG